MFPKILCTKRTDLGQLKSGRFSQQLRFQDADHIPMPALPYFSSRQRYQLGNGMPWIFRPLDTRAEKELSRMVPRQCPGSQDNHPAFKRNLLPYPYTILFRKLLHDLILLFLKQAAQFPDQFQPQAVRHGLKRCTDIGFHCFR
jgi:hypothetical protein